MALRDLLLFAVLMASIPVVIYRPWVGILLWYWIGLMNPHRLTWGFMYSFPVAMLVAVVTLSALIIARDREPPPLTKELVLLFAMGAWFTVTTYFAWIPSAAWSYWEQFIKILLFTFLTPVLIHGRRRVEFLVLVVTASIAFYGLKGGWFSLTSGFQNHVLGPRGTFIGGNTNLGLALVMVVPLVLVISRQLVRGTLHCLPPSPWTRLAGWGGYATFWLTGCAILGTFSRGAMLGMVAIAPFVFLRMRRKLALVALAVVAVTVVGVSMPERVVQRAETIQNYEEDGSAMGRIQAWGVAWNIAAEHPFGAGFNFVGVGDERWLGYANIMRDVRNTARAAHSNYFQVLGQHGFVGLGLYLALLGCTMLCLLRLATRARRRSDTEWIAEYAWGILVGTIGYAVAGAFLDMAYFTLFYAFIALTVILRREYERAIETEPVEAAGMGSHPEHAPSGILPAPGGGQAMKAPGPNRYGNA